MCNTISGQSLRIDPPSGTRTLDTLIKSQVTNAAPATLTAAARAFRSATWA